MKCDILPWSLIKRQVESMLASNLILVATQTHSRMTAVYLAFLFSTSLSRTVTEHILLHTSFLLRAMAQTSIRRPELCLVCCHEG